MRYFIGYRALIRVSACALVLAAAARPAEAVLLTWRSSATAGTAWSDATLWNPAQAPVSGDSLTFPAPIAGGSRSPVNDLGGLTVSGITFPANAYVLSGNAVNLAGNVDFTAGGTNADTISLGLVLQQDASFNVAATSGSGRLVVDGVISGSFGITKSGPGTMRWTAGAKTYTGSTTIDAGTLDIVTTDNTIPFGAGKGNVLINTGATLLMNNSNVTINGLSDGTSGGGAVSKTGSNTRTLSLGNGDSSGTFNGTISMSGGSSSVTKTGAGTQTLNGNVTVAGTGTVNGGKLIANGTWSQGVNVNSGATLGGTGTFGGTTTIANAGTAGTLAPGNSAGTINFANLVLNANAVLSFELNGADQTVGGGVNDLATVSGTLTLDGTVNVTETVASSFLSALPGQSWRLFNYSGALTNNTLAVGTTPTLANGNYFFTIDTSTFGQVNLLLNAVPVPEASAVAFGGIAVTLGAVGLVWRRRREGGVRG